MADTEINSFLMKFKTLCCAGMNASLNMSCSNGKATVTLQADVGFIGPPPPLAPQTPIKHRNPAYHRRIARRQAMRQTSNYSVKAEQAAAVMDEDILVEADKPDSVVDNEGAEQAPYNNDIDSNEQCTEQCGEEIDSDELERDKLVDQVIIHLVPPSDCRKKIPNAKEVEIEIRDRFASIGVQVKDFRCKTDSLGQFKTSLVKISPTNLKLIWGRRLGLQDCALMEYKKPDG